MKKILEVRWHGRGGQGAWTASELLARAAIAEGKHIQSFPEFGPERMGAPVTAFTRISTEPIMIHCAVYNPDVVAVLDPTLLKTVKVVDGLSEEGGHRDRPRLPDSLGAQFVQRGAGFHMANLDARNLRRRRD